MSGDEMKEGKGGNGGLWRRRARYLKDSTILSRPVSSIPFIGGGAMRRIREAVFPSNMDEATKGIKNPYEHAKMRMNNLWNWRERRQTVNGGTATDTAIVDKDHPLAKMTTVRGAMAAYFTGEQLKSSIKPALSIAAYSTFSAGALVFMLEGYADVISSLFTGKDATPGVAKFMVAAGVNYGSFQMRMKKEKELVRDMSFWMRNQFNQALIDNPNLVSIFQSKVDVDAPKNKETVLPHHAMGRATSDLAGSLINTSSQGFACVTRAAAIVTAIAHSDTSLPYLGDYGTLLLTAGVVIPYSWVTYKKGAILGKNAERTQEVFEKAGAHYDKDIVGLFDPEKKERSIECTKNLLEELQEDSREKYEAQKEHDNAQVKYASFMELSAMGNFVISPLPALPSLFQEAANTVSATAQQSFLATHAQITVLLNTVSQAISLVASRGSMVVPAKIISDMSRDFISAQNDVISKGDSEGGPTTETAPASERNALVRSKGAPKI